MWTQTGWALISDTDTGIPLLHEFSVTRWSLDDAKERATGFPERQRRNLRVVPATVRFGEEAAPG